MGWRCTSDKLYSFTHWAPFRMPGTNRSILVGPNRIRWQQNEDNACNTISNLSTMNNDNSNDPCQTTMKIQFNGTKVRQSTMIDNDRVKRARKCHALERKVSDIQTDNEKTVPGGFICPLTMEVMLDPVLDGEGNTFERSSLIQWLKQSPTSPVSRQPLSERMVTANNALRETIHEFMGSEWVLQRTIAEELKTGKKREDNDKYMCTNAVSVKEVSRMRAKIDCFLQNTCKEIGGIELKLNADGCCAFRYDTITIVLDVPENVGVFCLYTKDLIQGISKLNQDQLCRRAMELNFLQGTYSK
jgi:U-box domain